MNSFGITDKGSVRKENQDSFVIESCEKRHCVTAVICDGMGGAKAGDLASRLSCRAFAGRVYAALLDAKIASSSVFKKLLTESCEEANGVVYQYSRFDPECSGMGTTLVGGIVTRRRAYLVNVGDSRAYHLTRKGIWQITRDHSYVQMLVDSGAITAQEAKEHPKKNIIMRALGVERKVGSDYFEVDLRPGEAILLCSDGLSNTVSDDEMYSVFCSEKTPELICRKLTDIALERGASDNISVVIVKV